MQWRSARDGREFTASDLAAEVARHQRGIEDASKCKRQDIENLFKKDIRNPRYIAALASAMGSTVEHLKAGKYEPGVINTRLTTHSEAPPLTTQTGGQMSETTPLIAPRSLGNTFKHAPVVAWASLGEVLNRDNDEWPIEAMREIHTNKPVSRKTKWLEVQDDLLAPKVLKGDLVAVDPDGSPKLDSLVLAVAADGSYMLRFWRPLSGGQFELFDSAGRSMDSTRHGVRVVATFVTLQRDSL